MKYEEKFGNLQRGGQIWQRAQKAVGVSDPVTKSNVTKLEVTKKEIRDIEAGKRGRKPKGTQAMTAAERKRLSRERKKHERHG